MLYTCHILGLLALAPAAPIPGRHRPKDVALPVWPLSIEPSVETKSRPYGIVIQFPLDAAQVLTASEFRSLT